MARQNNPFGISIPSFDPLGVRGNEKDNERQHIGKSQKDRVFDSQNGKCHRCGNILKLSHTEYHHVKFVTNGGKSTTDNLVALCANCHSEIHKEEKAAKLDAKKRGRSKPPKENDPLGLGKYQIKSIWG